jgi:hypothetical protein
MIILFAMDNSLAAPAASRRRPGWPSGQAARAVSVGDWGDFKNEDEVCGRSANVPGRGDAMPFHRGGRGRNTSIAESGHRQQEPGRISARRQFERRVQRQCHELVRAAGCEAGRSPTLVKAAKPLLRRRAHKQGRRLIRRALSPPRRHLSKAASRHATVLANASPRGMGETARQIRSEFVTLLNRRQLSPWQVISEMDQFFQRRTRAPFLVGPPAGAIANRVYSA